MKFTEEHRLNTHFTYNHTDNVDYKVNLGAFSSDGEAYIGEIQVYQELPKTTEKGTFTEKVEVLRNRLEANSKEEIKQRLLSAFEAFKKSL